MTARSLRAAAWTRAALTACCRFRTFSCHLQRKRIQNYPVRLCRTQTNHHLGSVCQPPRWYSPTTSVFIDTSFIILQAVSDISYLLYKRSTLNSICRHTSFWTNSRHLRLMSKAGSQG